MLILAKFLANDRFVFGHPWPTLTRLLRYHGASAGALVVYWLVLNALSLRRGSAVRGGVRRRHGRCVRLEPDNQFPLGLGAA